MQPNHEDSGASTLRISLAQVSGSPLPEENLETAEQCVAAAAKQGSGLIVFPEMFMALPTQQTPLAAVGEPLDGHFVSTLCRLAKQYRLHIISGVWETIENDPVRAGNCAVAIDRTGELQATYRKVHLFNALNVRESETMRGGSAPPPVFVIEGIRLGLAICYDLRFPELFRTAAFTGVDGFIIPSAWYAGSVKEAHWLTLLRARAIENTMYTAGVNLCGTSFCGRSAAYDPFGIMQCDGGESQSLTSFTMTKQRVTEVRDKLPSLANARPELFGVNRGTGSR